MSRAVDDDEEEEGEEESIEDAGILRIMGSGQRLRGLTLVLDCLGQGAEENYIKAKNILWRMNKKSSFIF